MGLGVTTEIWNKIFEEQESRDRLAKLKGLEGDITMANLARQKAVDLLGKCLKCIGQSLPPDLARERAVYDLKK